MESAKQKNPKKSTTNGLTKVQSRLSCLENKLKKLIEKEKRKFKEELEIIIDQSDEIIVSNRVKEKQENKNKTKINKKYFNKIIAECENAVFVVDKNERIKETNKKMEEILGYEKESIKDTRITSILPLADMMENALKHSIVLAQHIHLFYGRRKLHLPYVETIVTKKSGNSIPFQIRSTTLKDHNNQLIGAVILLKDIEERKQVEDEIRQEEEKLKGLLDASQKPEIIERLKESLEESKSYLEGFIESPTDGIVLTDTSGFIKKANKTFGRILGYESNELIGKHWAEISPLEDKEYPTNYGIKIKGKDCVKDLLEKQEDLFDKGEACFEAHFRRKDGIFVSTWCSLYWIYNDKGERFEGINIVRDLTEKKLAEKELGRAYSELREAKEYLDNIISTSADGIIITDPQGTITRVNEAVGDMTGYSQDELKGMHVSQLNTHADSKNSYRSRTSIVDTLFRDGKVIGLESQWKSEDGVVIPIESNSVLLKDRKGKIIGGIIGVRDIRGRKKAEREIKEAYNFLENIFKTSADGIMITDSKGFITEVNEAVEKIMGYSRDEIIGKQVAEFRAPGKENEKRGKEFIEKLSKEGIVTGFEITWIKKDGSLFDIEMSATFLKDNEGNITGGVGSIRDITARKKSEAAIKLSEERYHNLIEYANDAVISANEKGIITTVNKRAEEMYGYSREEFLGKSAISLIAPGERKQQSDFLEKFRKNKEFNIVKKPVEGIHLRKDGKEFPVESSFSTLVVNGKYNFTAFIRDITERKKIQAIEMKNNFISNISHEFRTPLTLSLGTLEGLLREEYGEMGKVAKDQIGMALRNNRRLLKLVNQLLDFSRLESVSDTTSYYKKDINQFLSAIVDTFTFLAKKQDITLSFIPERSCKPVYIDPVKMEKVVFNIIGNAFKFTPRGGSVTIDVKEDKARADGDFVKISVKDTGIGIKEKDIPLIFDRFHQANGSSSRRHEGTGIGLSLAKELIELQGGKIKAGSEYGRGSTFTIYLPLGKDHINGQYYAAEERDETTFLQKEIELSDLGYDEVETREEKLTGERPLVLFIDDNLDVRRYVTGILRRKYDVITAEDGLQGLEKLTQYMPDVIISDVMMPRMDGYEFCKTLKSHSALKHIPLIFLTAKADTAFKIEGLEEGADDYIVKPFNSQELLARVNSLLRIQELVRKNMVKDKKITELTNVLHEKHHYYNIIGKSKPMQETYRLLENIKDAESPVLINGETGTGKEMVAHAIHCDSKRKDHPFIIMDCSVLNKNLLESELFGHVKGAFTGAIADKKGIFELADGGTLFLDEIGEMSLDTQVKLLRVLEEGTFRSVGSSEEKKVSVRIIAATNKDLEILIKKGKFREDLFYRINVITINLPSLRERKEDIPLLVEHFAKELNGNNGGKKKFAKEALHQLIEFGYPGNIRELKNIIESVFMLCESNTISAHDLPERVRNNKKETQLPSKDKQEFALDHIKKYTEREAILKALGQVNGNKSKAAKLLHISRATLYARLEEYQIGC